MGGYSASHRTGASRRRAWLLVATSLAIVLSGLTAASASAMGGGPFGSGAPLLGEGGGASPPIVEKLSPAGTEKSEGGEKVTIIGTGFLGATAVHFGSASAKSFKVRTSGRYKGEEIKAVEPPLSAVDQHTVDVTVTTPEGTSAITPGDEFTYVLPASTISSISPEEGKATGGTTVSISGADFIEVTAVDFGSFSAAEFKVNSFGSITAVSPAQTVGRVSITVTTPGGVSSSGICKKDHVHFPCPEHEHFKVVEPTITSVSPNSGPATGGTATTITGTGFGVGTEATVIRFGGSLATSVDCTSITTCSATAPEHKAGTVDVRATIGAAATESSPADQFTYE